MSDTVIKVENLSKLYRLGEVGTGTLSHDLNRWWARIRGKEDPFAKIGHINDRTVKAEKGEYVWALKDINFEVKRGEVLGIIGKNGAGKSTLLKILSRITAPTTGEAQLKGRVGSLLEVGTGFHPEMTGRENIYMNGTILGMTKSEITSKLDDIIDFAGIAKYSDTPVKRYSSGMMVRLGFAVAAFLEPEILIVDEVLAVGDAEFQKRAIGKMQEISEGGGRTVLFVSHNMVSISALCNKCLLIENGIKKIISETDKVIETYLSIDKIIDTPIHERKDRSGTGEIRIKKLEFETNSRNGIALSGFPLLFKIEYEKGNSKIFNPRIALNFFDKHKRILFTLTSRQQPDKFINLKRKGTFLCNIPNLPLAADEYTVNVWIGNNESVYDFVEDAIKLNVQSIDINKSGFIPISKKHGNIIVEHKWEIK